MKLGDLKQQKTNVALIALAVVLTGVTLWDRGRITTDEKIDRQHQLFDAWRSDEISKIHIELGDRTLDLQASRDEDGTREWTLREGDDAAEVDVDPQSVSQYMITLEYAAHEREVHDLDDAAMGTDKPRMLIRLEMGTLRYLLTLGGPAPKPEGALYATVEGGARGKRSYVLPRRLVEELELGPNDMRSHRLIPYLSTELESIELHGPKADWTLSRGGWGGRTAAGFMLKAPDVGDVRADRRSLDGWLTLLGRADVQRFVDVPSAANSGAHELILNPRKASAPRGRLQLGGKCPGGGTLLVRREPSEAAGCISEDVAADLLRPAAQFEDTHVVGIAEGDMIELLLTSGEDDSSVEVARKGEGWLMRKPQAGSVDEAAMAELVKTLLAAKGVRVPADKAKDRAALGLDKPRARVRIVGLGERASDDDRERIELIEVGQPRDGDHFVLRKDDGVVLKVAAEVAAALTPRASLLRDNQLYGLSLQSVTGLDLDCDGRRQSMTRDDRGAWTLTYPQDMPLKADMGLANELAGQIRQLAALRWVAEAPAAEHGLAEPWCRMSMLVSERGTSRKLELRLGNQTRGGHFAQHDDDPAVFVMARPPSELAKRWLLDRTALIADYSNVSHVVLQRGDKELVVDHVAEAWKLRSEPTNQLGPQLGKALEQLIAETVLRVGPADPKDGTETPALTVALYVRGAKEPLKLRVGRGDSWRGTSVFVLRRDDIEASFAVSQARVRPLLDAL